MQLQRPVFVQEQRLRMNTQLFQSIKLMELPLMDLREKIEEEIERNPALEVLDDPATVSLDAAVPPQREDEDYFESSSDSGLIRKSGAEASDAQQRFIEGALSRPQTLQQYLLWQLQLEPVDEGLREICETLIQNLNDDGFHEEAPETLFKSVPARLLEALRLVQALDPQGVCTANFRESLKVQIGLLPDAEPEIVQAIDHLELLERGKFSDVAKKLNCTDDEVRYFFGRIKQLSPFPGRRYAPIDIRYVVPDVQVVKKEGEFTIILNDEEIPVLGINPFFLKIAESGKKGGDKPTRDFAKENVKEAHWFINSINQRNQTLMRVTRAILEFQRRFFVEGPKFIAPLTLHDIAQELGVHEATVSRTANGKYMQTEWGIFELRHFFSNSISGQGSGGSSYSKQGVKEIIKEIIGAKDHSLTDQSISEMLAQRGIPLARRTVAKYRKELELGSLYAR
jgi:RNA polymerase sigma-54 factor